MKISKVAAATARRFYGMCQVNGRLDDARLRDLVTTLISTQPRDYRAILASIQRLARLEMKRREVLVESAGELDFSEKQRIESGLAAEHGPGLSIKYAVVPALLGGLRVRVGDDVLDGSVKSRLERLANAF